MIMMKQRRTRAPRVAVPNNEQALISVGSEQLKGTLCLVSLTGGTVRLEKRLERGTLADIGLKTISGKFTAAIELLDKTSNAQAFRFIHMGATARKRLGEAVKTMQAQGLGVNKTNAFDRLLRHAGRIMALVSAR